jgi:hypothetical protein
MSNMVPEPFVKCKDDRLKLKYRMLVLQAEFMNLGFSQGLSKVLINKYPEEFGNDLELAQQVWYFRKYDERIVKGFEKLLENVKAI